ncbi:hypothetical protein EAF07_08575 [Streptococcus hillyeri]|uniref:Uncharacterized protein n=1 Tax=Streptococcus hillyeri TaxID=2282420 RepID=A0A3L9DS09_9STRE|nr:hypothetical protein EAF07_08575 [Streptococcus hillyeri]
MVGTPATSYGVPLLIFKPKVLKIPSTIAFRANRLFTTTTLSVSRDPCGHTYKPTLIILHHVT